MSRLARSSSSAPLSIAALVVCSCPPAWLVHPQLGTALNTLGGFAYEDQPWRSAMEISQGGACTLAFIRLATLGVGPGISAPFSPRLTQNLLKLRSTHLASVVLSIVGTALPVGFRQTAHTCGRSRCGRSRSGRRGNGRSRSGRGRSGGDGRSARCRTWFVESATAVDRIFGLNLSSESMLNHC